MTIGDYQIKFTKIKNFDIDLEKFIYNYIFIFLKWEDS